MQWFIIIITIIITFILQKKNSFPETKSNYFVNEELAMILTSLLYNHYV